MAYHDLRNSCSDRRTCAHHTCRSHRRADSRGADTWRHRWCTAAPDEWRNRAAHAHRLRSRGSGDNGRSRRVRQRYRHGERRTTTPQLSTLVAAVRAADLTKILTYHVIDKRLTPADLAMGSHRPSATGVPPRALVRGTSPLLCHHKAPTLVRKTPFRWAPRKRHGKVDIKMPGHSSVRGNYGVTSLTIGNNR
jgi:hypothetical protein